MNTSNMLSRFLHNLACLAVLAVSAAIVQQTNAAENVADVATENLTHAKIFEQPLLYVGATPPSSAESQELWNALGVGNFKSLDEAVGSLQVFAQAHSNSPWAPSLNANLGLYYKNHGYFSLALSCWEKAWVATKDGTDANGKKVGDYALVNWLQLLASLGRIDTMKQLFDETQTRQIFAPFQTLYNEDRDGYFSMLNDPTGCYRCGTFALNAVARTLYGSNSFPQIVNQPSPATGFSMSALVDLAETNNLAMVAVERPVGDESLVVPSVVHWKANHYAAIISQHGDNFEIIDPTFRIHKLFTRKAINTESSGFFLVAEKQTPSTWKRMESGETAKIFGKGFPNNFTPPPCPCPDCNNCPPGAGGSGGSPGGSSGGPTSTTGGPGGSPGSTAPPASPKPPIPGCTTCGTGTGGMPDWRVNEPNIDLRLHDEPIAYQSSSSRVPFTIDYWQRDDRVPNPDISTMGPGWECSWFGYIDENRILFGPGGGEISFYTADGTEDGTIPNFYYNLRMLELDDTNGAFAGYDVIYPNGAIDEYGFIQTDIFSGNAREYLTKKIDPNGRTVKFIYAPYNPTNGVVRLDYVIDVDGKTNSLVYTNNSTYNYLLSQVKDPYNHTANFAYDINGYLTNVTDEASIPSSFRYGSIAVGVPGNYVTNYWLNALITPYGTNSFSFYDNNLQAQEVVNRVVVVTQPDNSHQMFVHYGWDSRVPYSYDDAPTNYPVSGVFDGGDSYVFDNENMSGRNTYYWNARQFDNISPSFRASGATNWNFTFMTANDYWLARTRHWAHTGDSRGQSDAIAMERAPSPDGVVEGEKTWYAYVGAPGQFNILGDSIFPALTMRVQPDGTDWYYFITVDQYGKITNAVDTYSTGFGQAPLTRTNIYKYSTNEIDLIVHIGPTGNVDDGYSYGSNHSVLAYTNAVGDVTRYTYDNMAKLTSVKTPAGLTTTNSYFASGTFSNFLQSSMDLEIHRTNTYTYTNGLVYTHTDERNLTITNLYDNLQRIISTSDPLGTVSYIYTNLDLVQVVDRMSFTNSFGYDRLRHKTAETNALGNYTLYSYCSCGTLDSIRDMLGNYTFFFYDNGGRLTNAMYPDGFAVTNYYSSLGELTNIIDSSGAGVTNWYNNQGLRYASSNAVGVVSALSFDIKDRATNIAEVNGVTIKIKYDELDRPLSRSYPDGGTERYGYTPNVLAIASYTNQLGNAWTYAYDAFLHKTNEIAVGAHTNSFAYNPAGDLLTLIDGKGQATTWKYDMFGRVTNKLDNLQTNLFIYSYDADNRMTNRISAAKGVTKYAYDAVGNLTLVDYLVSPDITLEYDAMNRLTNMVDAVGTTRYVYDAAGQVLSEDGPWDSDAVSYTYANRLRAGMNVAAPNGSPWSQSYRYDLARRLTNVTSPVGSFAYVLGGASPASSLVKELLFPGGAYITNFYDGNARLLGTYLRNSANANLDTEDYVYNLGSQRTQQVFTAGNYVNYAYDNIGELKTAIGHEPGGTTNRIQEQFGYLYDAAGNLNYRTNNTLLQQFNVNNLNELTTVTNGGRLAVAGTTASPATNVTVNGSNAILYVDTTFASTNQPWTSGNNSYTAIAKDHYGRLDTNSIIANLEGTNSYAYDLNGNLITNGTRVLEYDDENQLIRITEPNAWKSEFTYDGELRQRIRKEYTWNGSSWLQTNEVHYVYDGNLVIQERDGNNLSQVTYTRGTDLSASLQGAGGISGLLARTDMSLWIRGSGLGHAFYHADGSGNITALIYTNQSIAAKYEYDPYGNVLGIAGDLADSNVYRFSSKEFDNASGLVYYLYRYDDPSLQRWINRDPLGEIGGVNLYSFVHGDPINTYDFLGLASVGGPGGILGGLSGPFNGFWGRNGGFVGGIIGTIGNAIGNHISNNCGKNCKRGDCESCCKKGAAVSGAGIGIGAIAGCIGTGGLGCGISLGMGAVNGLAAYDTYKACMTGCQSKQP